MPGKSTKFKSTTFGEKTFTIIGEADMPLFNPAIFSVSNSISFLT